MNVPRNQISVALFDILTAVAPPGFPDWALAERGLTPYGSLTDEQLPYIGVMSDNQRGTQDASVGATKWELHYIAQLYLIRGHAEKNFADTVDDFLDAVEAAMQNGIPGGVVQNTLGGLVVNCFIDGEILINPAIASNQAAIQIPITVRSGI